MPPKALIVKRLMFFAVSTLACCGGARADATIDYDWDFVETEVAPQQATHRSRLHEHWILKSDNTIVLDNENDPRHRAHLGGTIHFIDGHGTDKVSGVKVQNGAIRVITRLPGSTIYRVIQSNGRDECSVEITYRRLPGHKYFEVHRDSNNEQMYESDERAENITCRVGRI